ncbi:hypothetical protein CDB3_12435 [Bacillus sp. CDB3]|nr:hypothetical protein CDB3_12435 [Bacillus sp. CDB3]
MKIYIKLIHLRKNNDYLNFNIKVWIRGLFYREKYTDVYLFVNELDTLLRLTGFLSENGDKQHVVIER